MSESDDFIRSKLDMLDKDKQPIFKDLKEGLEKNLGQKTFKVPIKGAWFRCEFDAVEVKKDRLVITADRLSDGIHNDRYEVMFTGTRAAYLVGFYRTDKQWPYLTWDIRAYQNHPTMLEKRVYVNGFYAHNEIRRMIQKMEPRFGFKNILNTYIYDNELRVKLGLTQNRTPEEIEKEWSRGLMESLGYENVELVMDRKIQSHWFKNKRDSLL